MIIVGAGMSPETCPVTSTTAAAAGALASFTSRGGAGVGFGGVLVVTIGGVVVFVVAGRGGVLMGTVAFTAAGVLAGGAVFTVTGNGGEVEGVAFVAASGVLDVVVFAVLAGVLVVVVLGVVVRVGGCGVLIGRVVAGSAGVAPTGFVGVGSGGVLLIGGVVFVGAVGSG